MVEDRHLDQENAYKLLGILQSYAPNGKAQELVAEMYRETSKHGAATLLRAVTAALLDGLLYGNWPWVMYTKAEQAKKEV